jgi:hypothetical protein
MLGRTLSTGVTGTPQTPTRSHHHHLPASSLELGPQETLKSPSSPPRPPPSASMLTDSPPCH